MNLSALNISMEFPQLKEEPFDVYEKTMDDIFGSEIDYNFNFPMAEDLESVDDAASHNEDINSNSYISEQLLTEGSASSDLWANLLEQAALNNDPMMSDTRQLAASSIDHCYSSAKDQKLVISQRRLDGSRTQHSGTVVLRTIKQEPKVITAQTVPPMVIDGKTGRPAQSLLKQNNNPLVKILNTSCSTSSSNRLIYPITRIKSEPRAHCEDEDVYIDGMPMTPPSSNQSSDSEGGASPRYTPPASPVRQVLVARASGYRYNPATALYSQPIPTSGILRLTEEERRTFITEGYPLPAKLPLNKIEERNLKKVRRKIKNKISAQESRRKKKEYMDQLEKKVEDIIKENSDLRQKCDTYETDNRSLISQLSRLQNMLKRISPKQVTAQAGTCVLVMVLCFAVFIGNWSPFSSALTSLGDSSFSASHSLHHPANDGSFDIPFQASSSRTLTSLAEENLAVQEPWPISFARHSLRWSVDMFSHIATLTLPDTLYESVGYPPA